MAAGAAHPVPFESAVEVSAVTDMRHEEITVHEAPPRQRSTLVWWLAGGLVVALAALIGLGAWGYATYAMTAQEQAAVAVVQDHIDATNAADLAALDATMTSDMLWTSYTNGEVAAGPLKGQEYIDFVKSTVPTFVMEQLGPMTVSSDEFTKITAVSVPMHVTISNIGADETGTSVFYVHVVDGTPQITQMTWLTLS